MRDEAINDAELVDKLAQPPERYLQVLQDFCNLVELNLEEVVASGEVILDDAHIALMHFGALNPTCMRMIVELPLLSSEQKESVYLQVLQANTFLPLEGLTFAAVPGTNHLALAMTISLDEKRGLDGRQLHDQIVMLVEFAHMGQELVDRSFGRAVFAGFNKI